MSMYVQEYGFHGHEDIRLNGYWVTTYRPDTEYTYTFENFFHPYVGALIEQLNRKSLPGLLDASYHHSLELDFFTDFYAAVAENFQISFGAFPKKNIDLADGGPYAVYNWELLFHVPLTIAVHLSKNQRFAEAQRWFHHIFDPTCTDTSIPPPQRFWKYLRFRKETDSKQIDEILTILSKPDDECTPTELEDKVRWLEGYQAILDHPFQPHRVARTRVIAYQYAVVMKYLDNLIAWGDSLFAQDTIESINEATQRYVLAANILGPRPQRIPLRGTARHQSYGELKAAGLEDFGNALVELEGKFPFNAAFPSANGTGQGDQTGPLLGIGRMLYFCIPRNDKLLTYWDTVGDRLQKIRNCMNIQGVVRKLALFDPPLDPGMLVKAAAAGIDIGSIVGGLNQPIGPVRAQLLIQQARELCAEVKGMGNALLSAIEKREGEQLSMLRQGHELKIQQLSQEVRFMQWKQAEEGTEALLRARASAIERYDFYLRLLGLTRDSNVVPDTFALGQRTPITEETFDAVYETLVGQFDRPVSTQPYPQLTLAKDEGPSGLAAIGGGGPPGRLYLNSSEAAELNTHLPTARDTKLLASALDTVAAILGFIPEFDVNLHFWGMGASSTVFGGSKLSDALKIGSSILQTTSAWEQDQAGMASRTAGYLRRADDWLQQANLASRELMQIGRQLIGSLIAEQIARQEYLNTKIQIEQTQVVDLFLHEKFTNEELYGWMQGELSRLYYEYYRFAFDVARKAERTMKHELMRPELDNTQFVHFNYWDAGRRGLLSGEALFLDLKRMELAYHEHNQREFEITRHVSLRQLDPIALLTLKVSGSCTFSVPEALFDLECAGHYLRRLKSVALSIPSVVGPYTGLHATLSLQGSSVRVSPLLRDGEYRRQSSEDDRFVDYLGSVQQIVTSSGLNDPGMFESNLRDERPLPFEGAGAISTWRLDLPARFPAFDRESISDVVLHLRYTARQGGELLGPKATEELEDQLEAARNAGLSLLFGLRHDFPTEWSAFAHGSGDFTMTLRKDHFPYMAQNRDIAIDEVTVVARTGTKLAKQVALAAPGDQADLTALSDAINGASRSGGLALAPDATVLKRDAEDDVFLLIRYHFD